MSFPVGNDANCDPRDGLGDGHFREPLEALPLFSETQLIHRRLRLGFTFTAQDAETPGIGPER
jgi:hypothetical protein